MAFADNEAAARELVERAATANRELAALEEKIGRESARYAKTLDEKQQAIKELREKAASVQRLADEQLLGLDQLEARVEQWQTQNNYQKHLLSSYVEGVGLPIEHPVGDSGAEQSVSADVVNAALQNVEKSLDPAWNTQPIVSANGAISESPVLLVGPVEVAFNTEASTGGLVIRDAPGEARLLDVFSRQDLTELASLQANGNGYLRFDPTLGNAYQLQSYDETFLGHLNKGGVWAIPIVFFGILSFVISVLKSGQFIKLPKIDTSLAGKLAALTAEYRDATRDKKNFQNAVKQAAADAGLAQKKLVQIALANPVSQQRDDLLVAYLMEYKHKLERFMGVVGTTAAIAPLLGLLGTVSGMISTFKMMTIFGSGDASTVSGGISEALVTTELGLVVAIPSLVVSALLTRKAKSYAHKLDAFAIRLSKIQFTA